MKTNTMTLEQKLTAAYMCIVREMKQQDAAAMYNVNQGQVSQAVTTVTNALNTRATEKPSNTPADFALYWNDK